MAAKKLNKSTFIRQQPASMSATEVIAAGKQAGLKISRALVHIARGRAAKGKTKRAAASNGATKPTHSKAAFVRARAHLSPREIVEDAEAAGLKLDVGYVYNVRGAANPGARRSTERTAPSVTRPITTASKVEDLLRAVAAEVGLARAVEVLEAERARVRTVLRG